MTDQQPDGLGTPAGGQPGFAPPAGPTPASGPQPPAGGTSGFAPPPSPAPAAWPTPAPDARIATPPTGRGPERKRPRRRVLVAGVLAASLALVGILSVLPLLPSAPAPVDPDATPPVLVTTSPSGAPGEESPVTGGELGNAVAFRTAGGSGSLTVVSAVWTDRGELPPVEGQRYLVLEVRVECSSGEVPLEPILFALESQQGRVLPGFGPEVADPLGGRVLEAGEQASGRLGFAVAPGPVELHLLDSDLRPVATAAVPGP